MIQYTRNVFTCENMLKLIDVYFRSEERNVQLSYCNKEGATSIKAKETVVYDGVTKTGERELGKEEIENIICNIFAGAGLEVIDIVNYGAVGTRVKEGNFTYVVKPGEENQFVIITKEMMRVKY